MARVIRFHELGGPEVLRIEDVVIPAPQPGLVQIRVKALGINRAEALLRSGAYIETAPLPSGLGLEAAGIIEAVGEGVDGLVLGDRVSIIPPISMVQWPAYAELINFPAEFVVRHPPTLSLQGAAAVWMPFLTAYGALIDIAGLSKGDFVAVTAASSSVGLAAIQIANRVGATPIAITRTSVKRQALHDAGAAHVLVSQEEDLQMKLMAIAGPDGVRVVFDAVAGPIFEPLSAAMSPGGIFIEYGGLDPEPTPFPLLAVLGKGLTLRGYLVHEIVRDPARLQAAKTFILEGLAAGALEPVTSRTFPFEQIVEAHRFLESNEQFGKIVVTV
ncbi:zinc-dependent alcohol dehydrogenase family protein [Rhizobium lentis]|uniref:Zinc-dependent alcohol dehydrogenase family protein n=1 Tax=Rhizobium lentis TaxID=1138194 RepID=A0ABS7IE39_9HYPH|nr:zinc-dependent alcohol dehydrogenase family protein [Rhizobium lentis]MBX4997841.1 zinc-dependent alcohol dehydrogenase family protein [Rhizobium lentis]MBX5016021.1 zinc-dependent alcohol dehydrogenase family protein [Rhizobium lentis]MBX5065534.1 zinc-dependent alcohol dehydrogenase family protein [Rhizobium lentis]MBX5077662.1 zinc-dependent alcohol dehydrogenase family protein [Rhizobium lentis]MBX5088757.1 zinc-dependent alcohol dehydrogenase family protein [Rhizobium lentis]